MVPRGWPNLTPVLVRATVKNSLMKYVECGIYSIHPPPQSILEAVTGDQQMRFSHPEDVVDGSGCQDLSHGLRDNVRWFCSPHLHGAQEANNEELVEDWVWTTGNSKRFDIITDVNSLNISSTKLQNVYPVLDVWRNSMTWNVIKIWS